MRGDFVYRQAARNHLEDFPFAAAQHARAGGRGERHAAQRGFDAGRQKAGSCCGHRNGLIHARQPVPFVDHAVHTELDESRQHPRLRDHGHHDDLRARLPPEEMFQKADGTALPRHAAHAKVREHVVAWRRIQPLRQLLRVLSSRDDLESPVPFEKRLNALHDDRMVVRNDRAHRRGDSHSFQRYFEDLRRAPEDERLSR